MWRRSRAASPEPPCSHAHPAGCGDIASAWSPRCVLLLVMVGLLMPEVHSAREAARRPVAMHDGTVSTDTTPPGSFITARKDQSQVGRASSPHAQRIVGLSDIALSGTRPSNMQGQAEPNSQAVEANDPFAVESAKPRPVELYNRPQSPPAQQAQSWAADDAGYIPAKPGLATSKSSGQYGENPYSNTFGFYTAGNGNDQTAAGEAAPFGERLDDAGGGQRSTMGGGMGGGRLGSEGVARPTGKGATIAARARLGITRGSDDVAEEKERLSLEGSDRGLPRPRDTSAEAYDATVETPFEAVARLPLSTFSIDVDTASYANVRRVLHQGMLPPAAAVRIEELVNYFRYDYAPPQQNEPFAVAHERGRVPLGPHAPAGADWPQGQEDHGRRSAGQQPGFPSRRIGLDARCQQAAAGESRIAAAGREARRERSGRDRRLCRRLGRGVAIDAGEAIGKRSCRPSTSSKRAARPTAARAFSSRTTWPPSHFIRGGSQSRDPRH